MFSFLRNNLVFNADWSSLNIIRDSFLGKYSQHNVSHTSLMQKSFGNDQVSRMKTQNLNLKVNREKAPNKSPKVILKRLNINKTDNILILDDKIYIEKKEMTGQRKTGRRDLVVKGGKTYEGYQDPYNRNFAVSNTSAESSLLHSKHETQIKTHLNDSQNGSSDSYNKPLRQINGNVKPKNTIILSGVDSQKVVSETEVTAFWLPGQSLSKYDRNYQTCRIQKQKNERSNGILSRSVVTKPLKRLSSNSPPSLFSRLKSVFSSRNIHSANHSNPVLKSNDPFKNWCNDGMPKKSDCDRPIKSGLKRPNKFLSVSQRSKRLQTSCKVTLERVDAKICFMHYLRLKPSVKTDVRKMLELSLLRKHNIRNCLVVISRKTVEARGRT